MQDYLAEESLDYSDRSIGEFLLSVLTGGLYVEPHLILREYIQNAHDAFMTWGEAVQPQCRIDIKISPPNIHIYDNGPGMSRVELIEAMSKVGVSSKPFGATTGFMGIGKLAGLSMASRVQIDTSKRGIPDKNRVTFYAEDMITAIEARHKQGESRPLIETLKEHSHLNREPMPEEPEAHYTAVHLLGISEDHWNDINKRDEFLKRLGLVAPVGQDPNFRYRVKRELAAAEEEVDFAQAITDILDEIAPEQYYPVDIYVDGIPLYRPWCHGLLPPRRIEVLDEEGNPMAYGWACQHKESEQIPDPLLRGLALLQRGIAIGERDLAEDLGLYGTSPSSLIYFRWFMGEIYITDPRILLTANRMSLRRNPDAQHFLERVKAELRKLSIAAARFSERDNAAKKAPQDIREIRDLERKVGERAVSSEAVPAALRRVVKARDDLRKRLPHLGDAERKDAGQAIQTADSLIPQLANIARPEEQTALDEPRIVEQVTQPGVAESTERELMDTGDITVSEEEAQDIVSVADRLGFTDRERRIFQLIVDAVAEVSGGRDTDAFAKYLQRIEEVLSAEFQRLQSGIDLPEQTIQADGQDEKTKAQS